MPDFEREDEDERLTRGVLTGSVIATGFIIAPVAFHRVLFRQGERRWIVAAANRAARAGLFALAATTSGVVWLVFDLVTNRTLANVASVLSVQRNVRCDRGYLGGHD